MYDRTIQYVNVTDLQVKIPPTGSGERQSGKQPLTVILAFDAAQANTSTVLQIGHIKVAHVGS